eukprot:10335599-Lingulodinium_polyedra.AAC.1
MRRPANSDSPRFHLPNTNRSVMALRNAASREGSIDMIRSSTSMRTMSMSSHPNRRTHQQGSRRDRWKPWPASHS